MENALVAKPQQLPTNTLELEVKSFADALPDWAKYICQKLLAIGGIDDADIATAYHYLLEDAGLKEKPSRAQIKINLPAGTQSAYKSDLLFTKVRNVEGVNALAENQVIEFGPNITIIYGSNGSGKSGYIRLFNNAFLSKGDKAILSNIYAENGHKITQAELVFKSSGTEYTLKYPQCLTNGELRQFSVFDNKSVPVYLNNRNQFEFRPASLEFFGDLIEAFKKIEQKVNADIDRKSAIKDYASFFDGESEVKAALSGLSDKTSIDNLKKFLPFTEADSKTRNSLEEKKAQLQAMKKEKEIAGLEEKKQLVDALRKAIESNNRPFTDDYILKIRSAISDCISKENLATSEGIQKFKTDRLKGIGSPAWKTFLESAERFSNAQVALKEEYPKDGDICLLCHQTLPEEARKLISSYWAFIKSNAEQEAKDAQAILNKTIDFIGKMKFDLLPPDSILFKWFNEEYADLLGKLRVQIDLQKDLADNVNQDLRNKEIVSRDQVQIETDDLNAVIVNIDAKIKELREQEPIAELQKINKEINLLNHRDKLQHHIEGIESYIGDLKWSIEASSAKKQLSTRKVTEKEKELSAKYFNQTYFDTFNKECIEMNGNFGIDINHTGSAGTSYRQLLLRGKQPTQVLSEGEQKVIALADFISENRLSGINKGLIFDDPVTSLDEERKAIIARRLVEESKSRQIVIFTHDLVFVSSIITSCEERSVGFDCHWIENNGGKPGTVYLKNAPTYEKMYKKSGKAQQYYEEAKKCAPAEREDKLKNGFAALRTSYESMVVFDLFKGVVQRFNERVSIDSLSNVFFDMETRDEILDSFYQCCRYMEGHLHSDKYAYKKPTVENLIEEINRFNDVKKKISELGKLIASPS